MLNIGGGVPGYFGDQGFRIDGNNFRKVARRGSLAGTQLPDTPRPARSTVVRRPRLSFNLGLSERARRDCWLDLLPGEGVLIGVLWGPGHNLAVPAVAKVESDVLDSWTSWWDGVERAGLKQDRRPLVLIPEGWRWCWQKRNLLLNFSLPRGELCDDGIARARPTDHSARG